MSVCMTHDEARLVREAAALAGLSISSWSASRIASGLSSAARRAEMFRAVTMLADNPPPRGTRTQRISAVMREPDHDLLVATAAGQGTTPHNLAQAILLTEAEADLAEVPREQRADVEAKRRAERHRGTVLVSTPAEYADRDDAKVSAVLRQALNGVAAAIRADKASGIAEGVKRMVSRQTSPMVTVRLTIPEFELRALAHVLDIPAATLATGLAIKAAKAVS